jgi:signal transduction histidine kinase
VSAPTSIHNPPRLITFITALGFDNAVSSGAMRSDAAGVLAAFAGSDTFRWLRRWAVLAVIAIVTPITVLTAYSSDMPEFHHLAVPIALAVIVSAWVLEFSGVRKRLSRLALIAATVLPNVWLTLIGHISTNYLWLTLLVIWVGFAGTLVEGLIALCLSVATITLGVAIVITPGTGSIPWEFWTEWTFSLVLTWFMGRVLRRQVVLAAELRASQSEAEHQRRQIEVLYDADERLYRSLRLEDVLESLVDVAGELLRPDKVAVGVLDAHSDRIVVGASRGFSAVTTAESLPPDEVPALRAWLGDGVVVMEDVQTESRLPPALRAANDREGVRSSMTAPIRIGEDVTGAFGLSYCEPRTFTTDEQRLLQSLAQRAGLAIQNARLYEQSQRAATLEERQRLSRELHDSVTQSLYGISLYSEAALRAMADGETEPAASNLREIRETTQEALAEMRLLLFDLRPAPLQEHGLAAALRARLQAVEARAGIVANFVGDGDVRLRPGLEQELYRVAQEALNNILKHAHATRVDVRLSVTPGAAELEIVDDGVGFDPSLQGVGGFGVPGMRERVERLGGTLHIESSPGAGTRVVAEVRN